MNNLTVISVKELMENHVFPTTQEIYNACHKNKFKIESVCNEMVDASSDQYLSGLHPDGKKRWVGNIQINDGYYSLEESLFSNQAYIKMLEKYGCSSETIARDSVISVILFALTHEIIHLKRGHAKKYEDEYYLVSRDKRFLPRLRQEMELDADALSAKYYLDIAQKHGWFSESDGCKIMPLGLASISVLFAFLSKRDALSSDSEYPSYAVRQYWSMDGYVDYWNKIERTPFSIDIKSLYSDLNIVLDSMGLPNDHLWNSDPLLDFFEDIGDDIAFSIEEMSNLSDFCEYS